MKGECSVFSISKFTTSSDPKALDAQRLIDTFRCPVNPSVERFLHQNAIDFSKKKQSITHLVCNEHADLLGWALAVVKDVQAKVGGVILFLECEDNERLKKFYESNGFSYFDKRKTNDAEENELLQYYRFI